MSKYPKTLVALAATALLAACGGGSETAASAQAADNAAAAASAMRAQAQPTRMTAQAVSAVDAAEQLLNFAENSVFKNFFPSHQTTQSLEVFRFRFYPQTGIYLGVVVIANPTYALNGVYVMGGEFGNSPVYVGQVNNFITPVDPNPGPGPTGPNNGCFDLALSDTQGTRIVAVYDYSGVTTGTQTVTTVVGGMTTFEGQQARLSTSTTTGTNTTEGETINVDTEIQSYARRTGDAEVTHYGSMLTARTTMAGQTFNSTTRMVWTPPWLDRQYALGLGESYTSTQTVSVTSTVFGQTTTSSSSYSENYKFAARETVTVPAGTYATCKFEMTDTSSPNEVTTTWVIAGKGIAVKTVTVGNNFTQTVQARSIQLNGAPL